MFQAEPQRIDKRETTMRCAATSFTTLREQRPLLTTIAHTQKNTKRCELPAPTAVMTVEMMLSVHTVGNLIRMYSN